MLSKPRSFSPLAGRRCRGAADEGRHPAVIPPPPAPPPPPPPLSPRRGARDLGKRTMLSNANISTRDFRRFQALVQSEAGIFLSDQKRALLVGRLSPQIGRAHA